MYKELILEGFMNYYTEDTFLPYFLIGGKDIHDELLNFVFQDSFPPRKDIMTEKKYRITIEEIE